MKNYWDETKYQQLSEVTALDGSTLLIGFENGDAFRVEAKKLIPNHIEDYNLSEVKYDSFSISIPTSGGEIEIPWDKVRVLTDSDFGKYLADKAADSAKKVGERLKQLREVKGIKSKELAIRSGLTPQTISRIEKGHTDVGFSTLRKILASMGYTLSDLAQEEMLDKPQEKSFKALLNKLGKINVDAGFVTNRLIPANLYSKIQEFGNHPPSLLLDEIASYISAIYGWSVNDIWRSNELEIDTSPSYQAFYKKSAKYNVGQIKAYSHYAHRISSIVGNNLTPNTPKEMPGDVHEFTKTLLEEYGEINLNNILDYAWDLGIAVIPLSDSGIFHGASWNIEGKKVVVLKQKVTSHARWMFDLLHEIYHAFVHLDEPNSGVIETDEINPLGDNDSEEEREANSFANMVIFRGNADTIAEECVSMAEWDIRKLKKTVPVVAKQKGIAVDSLANYLAFRLAHQGTNWWGVAQSFQIENPSACEITKNKLLANLDLDKMSSINRNLVELALA